MLNVANYFYLSASRQCCSYVMSWSQMTPKKIPSSSFHVFTAINLSAHANVILVNFYCHLPRFFAFPSFHSFDFLIHPQKKNIFGNLWCRPPDRKLIVPQTTKSNKQICKLPLKHVLKNWARRLDIKRVINTSKLFAHAIKTKKNCWKFLFSSCVL